MHDQGAGEADALAHAAGEFLWIGALVAAEADQVDRLLGPLLPLGPRHALRLEAEFDVFLHGEPGKQREALEHHSHTLRRAGDKGATPAHLAGGREQQARDDPQERGFA